MEILIKVGNVRILLLSLVILLSCKGSNIADNNLNYIILSSIFEKDYCTFSIDDRLYIDNKIINTNSSLGIDLNSDIRFNSSKRMVNFHIKFEGEILPDVNNEKRVISLDTIIDIRKGKYFLVTGRLSNIEILQSKKKIALD